MATPPRGYGPPGGPYGPGGGQEESRNFFLFMAIMVAFLIAYQVFIVGPRRPAPAPAQRAQQQQQQGAPAQPILSRQSALAATARAPFDNARIAGSLSLTGARLDDLSLKDYRQTVSKNSPDVTLLNPMAAAHGYDAVMGWDDPYTNEHIVGPTTSWTQASPGAKLTPDAPIVLTYTGANGLVFTRTISLDNQNMFTIADTIRNTGGDRRAVRAYSTVRRAGLPADYVNSSIIMQGMVGEIGPNNFHDFSYANADKKVKAKLKGDMAPNAPLLESKGTGGWTGLSDHYWLTAVIPPQSEPIDVRYDANQYGAYTDYRVAYYGQPRTIDPGASITYTEHVFAGAKRADVLQGYQKSLGIPDFDKAIDWGNFWILTRPFFWLLDSLGKLVGNFGLAILLTTVVIRAFLFPLVNSQSETMSKMRKIQPRMKEIQERFAADKERQQQEMMKLYQSEKINPLSGCLPLFAQIPVFFALYKTLSVTIEMRHAPFFGWIQDLSARDPTNLFDLFGLIPWITHALGWGEFHMAQVPIVGGFLWLGAWPLLYGISMYASQMLTPPVADPTQQMIFRYMPVAMAFIFGGLAAGIVIYYTWSTLLSFVQQYVIMRKNGVETEVDKFIKKHFANTANPA